jgi:hypothetical protein
MADECCRRGRNVDAAAERRGLPAEKGAATGVAARLLCQRDHSDVDQEFEQ